MQYLCILCAEEAAMTDDVKFGGSPSFRGKYFCERWHEPSNSLDRMLALLYTTNVTLTSCFGEK
jgi:hypothetical protein